MGQLSSEMGQEGQGQGQEQQQGHYHQRLAAAYRMEKKQSLRTK
jgi:hypothetical protein